MTILVSRYPSEQSRLGFAIARKQVKRAVDRNRLKRLFRESFRCNREIVPNRDFVIMVRSPILKLDNRQISTRLQNFWHKATRL